MATEKPLTPQEQSKKDYKREIEFYMQFLDNPELEILRKLSHSLAFNYSKSYAEWKQNENSKP